MKNIFTAIAIMLVLSVFSQDVILTKNKRAIESNIISIGKDFIKYSLFSDSLQLEQSINIIEVNRILYADGNIYIVKRKKTSRNKSFKPRTDKRGIHIGIDNFGGTAYGSFYNQYDYYDGYSVGRRVNEEYFGRAIINAKLYINNIFGVKAGIGYTMTKYNEYYNIYDSYNTYNINDSYYSNRKLLSKIKRYNYISSVAIPLRAYITPGNKFGFYLEWGATINIPIASTYHEIKENISNNGSYVVNTTSSAGRNSISNYSPIGSFSGTVGFHATIKEQIIVFAGPSFETAIINESNNGLGSYFGFKFGASYHILKRKKKK